MNSETKNILIIAGLIAGIFLMIGGLWLISQPKKVTTNLTPFAQCLAGKKVTMYGAYWCTHCQNQKALFGAAFEEVPHVECTTETNACQAKGVESFPTWFIPDGKGGEKKLVGEQTLETLAKESGCEIPAQ